MARTAKRHLIAAFCFAMGCAGSAQADVIFSDAFDRVNSNSVGNGWAEVDQGPGDRVSITSNTMQFAKNGTFEASHVVSTIGFENIELSYDWRGDGSEANGILNVYWSTNGTFNPHDPLASHSLSSISNFTQASLSLPAAAEDISSLTIWYSFIGSGGNDSARIDNVSVSGDALTTSAAATAVPEPGSLVLLGSGLVAFGFVRRRALWSRWVAEGKMQRAA